MALSGTINSGTFGNGSFRLRLVWSASQSVANNTSNVSVTMYLDSLTSWGKINDATNSNWNINIDGASTSGNIQSDVSGNGSRRLGSWSRTVSHSSDGTKSLDISGSHYIDINWSGSFIGTRSVSGRIHLNTIPRTSSVGFQGSSTGEMGKYNDIYIKINRHSSSFTHTLKYTFGSKSGTIANKIGWVDHEWTIPADLATEVTSSTSGWGTITCETYSGNTRIGTNSARFYATVPNNSNYNPTIGSISLSETNNAVKNAVGSYYVQGRSKIKISATGGTKYGASIRSIVFRVKNSNHTASMSGSTGTTHSSPADSGNHSVVATITDSRGRTATSSTSFNVTAYSPPKITDFRAFRLDSPNTTIQTIGTASMSAIGTANTTTIRILRSPKGQNQWVEVKKVTATSGSSVSTGSYNIVNMDITNSFDIQFEVWDELTPNKSTQVIPVGTAIFPMSWGKTGIGVGTVFNPNGSALQVVGGITADEYVAQQIPSGANLNDYTKSGLYFSPSNADVGSMKNTPTGWAFSLKVSQHAGTRQTLETYFANEPAIYVRNFYAGSWGSWRQVYSDYYTGIESGSNSTGEWLKLPDGTQITYCTVMWNPNSGSQYFNIPLSYGSYGFNTHLGAINNDLYSIEEVGALAAGKNNGYQVRMSRNGDKVRSDLTWNIGVAITTIGRWK